MEKLVEDNCKSVENADKSPTIKKPNGILTSQNAATTVMEMSESQAQTSNARRGEFSNYFDDPCYRLQNVVNELIEKLDQEYMFNGIISHDEGEPYETTMSPIWTMGPNGETCVNNSIEKIDEPDSTSSEPDPPIIIIDTDVEDSDEENNAGNENYQLYYNPLNQ